MKFSFQKFAFVFLIFLNSTVKAQKVVKPDAIFSNQAPLKIKLSYSNNSLNDLIIISFVTSVCVCGFTFFSCATFLIWLIVCLLIILLEILFEDNHLIIVNKKAGDLIQGDITKDKTLGDKIKDYLKKKYSKQNIIWEGEENPYLALMHYSKYLICTSDSVSIISESVSAKKPVFIYKLPTSKRNNRIESFISTLVKKNYVKILSDRLEDYSNSYENETTEVAKTINERYSNQ